jgi:hypothetical protein
MSKGFLTEGLMDELSKIADMMGIDIDKVKDKVSSEKIDGSNLKSKIVGSSWKSCSAYRSNGGLSKWSDKILIDKSPSKFEITYKGPSSGLSIAHATGGKDTIHQLYNVIICELNPYLSKGGIKPIINRITTKSKSKKNTHLLRVTIPLESESGTWQIDRRGGWNHDPGSSKMDNKCKKVESSGGKCEGPVTDVAEGDFGKITEYFITHTI